MKLATLFFIVALSAAAIFIYARVGSPHYRVGQSFSSGPSSLTINSVGVDFTTMQPAYDCTFVTSAGDRVPERWSESELATLVDAMNGIHLGGVAGQAEAAR
jgi:hypothetical protein